MTVGPDRDELVERALETAHAISQYEPEQTAIGVMLTELANRIQADAATIAGMERALAWAEDYEPLLVELIRKRAALKGGDHG